MSRPEVISAIPTPFSAEGTIDEASVNALLEHVGSHRIDAVFVNGTTAEFPALSRAERRMLVATAVRVLGPDRTIAHVGASSGYEAALLTQDAIDGGADRFAAVTPYYMHSDVDDVRRYFDEIRAVAPAQELHLYHYPARTGVQLSPSHVATLVNEFDLAGVKVSIPGVDYVAALVRLLGGGRVILTGNDGLMAEAQTVGGDGVVSGISSVVPEPFVQLADALGSGGDPSAVNSIVNQAVSVLGPSIRQIKTALCRLGITRTDRCRMSIPAQTSDDVREVERLLASSFFLQDSRRTAG